MIKVSVMHPNNAGAHFKLWGAHPTLTAGRQILRKMEVGGIDRGDTKRR